MCLSCDDFEGRCCSSCHEDAQEGYYNGEMCSIYRGDDLFAHVCCLKSDDAEKRLAIIG
jgi:hypothetical protein